MSSPRRPLTPAQRARKVAAAKKRLREAEVLLSEVCDDYSRFSYRLTVAESADYRATVDLIAPLERMDLPRTATATPKD